MTVTAYSLDAFVGNTGTSPKLVTNAGGLLAWTPHNLLRWSEAFDNSSVWGPAGIGSAAPTVTANSVVAPDGNTTAEAITFPAVSAANNVSFISQVVVAVGPDHTLSCWLKGAVGGENIYLIGSAASVYIKSRLTLTTAWVRYSISGVTPTWGSWNWSIGTDLRDPGQATTSACTVHAWGAHLNRGPTAQPYLMTTSVPRCNLPVDYDPVTKLCRGVMSEPTATNILMRSTPPTATADNWQIRGGLAVTAGQTDPMGLTGASLIAGLTGQGGVDCFVVGSAGLTVSAPCAPSFYIKKVTASGTLRIAEPVGNNGQWDINLASLGSGWERISSTHPAVTVNTVFNGGTGGNAGFWFFAQAGGPLSFHLWGCQIENGTIPTSLILTTSAVATRPSDIYKILPSQINYSNTAGTWWVEVTLLTTASPIRIVGYPSAITPIATNGATGFINFWLAGSINTLDIAPDIIGTNKVVTAYQANDVAITVKGLTVRTATSDMTNLLTTPADIHLGSEGSAPIHGWLRKLTYRQRRISNAEMQTETA